MLVISDLPRALHSFNYPDSEEVTTRVISKLRTSYRNQKYLAQDKEECKSILLSLLQITKLRVNMISTFTENDHRVLTELPSR